MIWNPHVGNIFQVYSRADRWDRSLGMASYEKYHELMAEIYYKWKVPSFESVVGVFASLSPNNSYAANIRDVHSVFQGVTTAKEDDIRVTTYRKNLIKALRIAHGESPLEVLGGKKVRSFYLNILNPDDIEPITIDGHMYSVWMLKRFNMDDAKVGGGSKYDLIAKDFKTVAKTLGLRPNQLQAICWLTWRRIHYIHSSSQLDLFNCG